MGYTDIYNKNNIYQHLYVLKTNRNKRYRYGEFLVEGVRNINKAVAEGWKVKSFLFSTERLSDWAYNLLQTVPTERNYRLREELMKELSDKEDTSELVAVVEMRDIRLSQLKLSENPFIILFDRPSNKGNLGTMIRTCDALGADCLIITGHGVDMYDPGVLAASMGSFFQVPVIRVEENREIMEYINSMKARYPGFHVVGTTAHKQNPIDRTDFSAPVLLMLGNETVGLNHTYQQACDLLATIPMAQGAYASSFNVSCAAAIMMYEIVRQRGYKK